MKLFVGNIPSDVPEELLKWQLFPHADDVRLVRDTYTGRSRGYAFVEVGDQRIADSIVMKLNGYVLANNKLNISYVKESSEPRIKSDRGIHSSFDDKPAKRRKDFKQIRRRNKDDFDD